MKKIRIAFIKYGGLTAGGSEKFLQFLASGLPKDIFEVYFFYCDQALTIGGYIKPRKSSLTAKRYLTDNGVNLCKFNVRAIDLSSPTLSWVDTDFWDVFIEKSFDIVQTCRAGHKEYPFNKIKETPIVDVVALNAGVDNQYNVSRVVHLSNWSRSVWFKAGGDKNRSRIGSLPIIKSSSKSNYRVELNLEDRFVFGLHQRNDDSIFSEIPLKAYSLIESSNTSFVVLGGSKRYKEQAKELKLKNCFFLDYSIDQESIYKFLRTINVFAHGRYDGEINSQAIAEAMSVGLPVVSHVSQLNNGHIECISDAGVVVSGIKEYANELTKLMSDKKYYDMRSANAKKIYLRNYEPAKVISFYVSLYREVISDPYPKKISRFIYSILPSQNIRLIFVFFYRKFKYFFNQAFGKV